MSLLRSRQLVVAITAIAGFIVLVPYYFRIPFLEATANSLQNWTVVILGFAMGFGALTITINHSQKIMARKKDWQYSVILLVSLFAMLISGLIPPLLTHPVASWIFQNIQVRISTTLFALLAPYVASSAYRAFRARNVEAGIMLITAAFIMLGNTPLMGYVWTGFPAIGAWINLVLNMAGQRGITIGVAIGSIAIGVRILLGLERSYLGEEVR